MTAPGRPSWFAPLRRRARWLRRLPDRLLHPLRRRRAARRLLATGSLESVLVICHGNICRSPFAAAVLRRGLAASGRADVRVDSAGFIGPGRAPPAAAQEAAAARGYDLASHASRLVAEGELPGYDLILVMDRRQRRRLTRPLHPGPPVLLLGDFDPAPIPTRTIPDPVNGSPELFATVYTRIERCLGSLLGLLPQNTGT